MGKKIKRLYDFKKLYDAYTFLCNTLERCGQTQESNTFKFCSKTDFTTNGIQKPNSV